MSKALKKWTPEEDESLLQQIRLLSSQEKVKDWTAIASAVPGGLRKGPWDPSEDRRLAIGVKEYGLQWPLVAEEVGTRSADQCAKRWQHSLDPSLDRSKWSEEEERKLLKAVEKHGRAWKQIQTEFFPGRATNNVKNKYSVLTRKREPQNPSNEAQDYMSSSGENGIGDTSSERMTSPSPCQAPEDMATLITDDAMVTSNDCDRQQLGDHFGTDLYAHSMDLDMNTADSLETDILFNMGCTDLDSSTAGNVNDSLFASDVSTATQPDMHTGMYFDSRTDTQSMPLNMDFLQSEPAKLVLTIENPSPDAITGIMGVLVPRKAKFKMEML